jgi:thiol-disulfide isomerase/thioredoxin
MSKKITVILARASWCPHCQHFESIYKMANDLSKKHKFLKDYEIEFKNYDLADDSVKNTFALNHNGAQEKIQGYPTVLVNLNNSPPKYNTVEHTVINGEFANESEQELLEEKAAERFLENIVNLIKNNNSGNKVLHIQNGGNMINKLTQNFDEIYRKKYLKYKSKYLELKNTQN